MTIFRHENFLIDLTNAHKGKLFMDNTLVFYGDGYKAITMMIRNCKNSKPVEQKFKSQLSQREKCKFAKTPGGNK
jgi:hypothetical protein